MSDTPAAIRRVEVELLRRGPRHNQLLSPLTDYLAICGEFEAGVVNAPYEQADAQNLLDDLRYAVSSSESPDRLESVRERAGTQLATMLGAIPGLDGTLATDRRDSIALTHLRLVTSAAELALLPFELAKCPTGSGGTGSEWLLLQPDRPVCLTRRIRGVVTATEWPLSPKILFVSGDDVPFGEHLDVFERVLAPYRSDQLVQSHDNPRLWTSQHLTVIERATLDEIRAAAENGFTHVHVLAHGAEIELRRSVRYGLAIGGRVVTGGELALALAATVDGQRHLPSVVTLASCDSAAQGEVTTPGGSVAHDLHAAGIPLVVGSQFPISEQASIPFAETFYEGQLRGEHPLVSITNVRRQLATDFADEHAWASLVVYEALPADFQRQLDQLQYWQSRAAYTVALDRLEAVAHAGSAFPDDYVSPSPEAYDELVATVTDAERRLPLGGAFGVECDGLRAAAAKRTAEVAYRLSRAPDAKPERLHELIGRSVGGLELALERYSAAVRAVIATSDGATNQKATSHWIVGQVLALQVVLGRQVDHDLRGVAGASARFDLDHPDPLIRGWATVSLIEQAILDLAIDGPSEAAAADAIRRAGDLLRATGDDSEHVMSTRRQMRRYSTWWGDPAFIEQTHQLGIERPIAWDGAEGVVATVRAVIDVLTPARRSVSPVPTAPAGPVVAPAIVTEPPAEDIVGAPSTGTLTIELLPARNGDCLWITYGDTGDTGEAGGAKHHVMIDCGSTGVAEIAAERVRSVPAVELFVLTHIDADHISGAIPLFGDADVADRFGDVWFNGWDQLRGFLGVAQGEQFSELLSRPERTSQWNGTTPGTSPVPSILTDGAAHPEVILPGGLRLTVLSPTRRGLQRLAANWHAALQELDPARAMLGRRPRPTPPAEPATLDLAELAGNGPTRDTSVPNLSSIAVLAEFADRAMLLTGDAHADVLAASIRSLQEQRGRGGQRLRLDALKLSHHGSANATTIELLDTIQCSNYLVSTDGSIFYHPDRAAIARVILHGGSNPTLHFNYRTDLNTFWDDPALQQRYGYSTRYPTEGDGLVVEL